MLKNQKGFTLIELLIVIVIIGILAGVLIAVIDPVKQQNRAKDAGVQATMNKVALATEGFVSAYGRTPTDSEFIGSLQKATPRMVGAVSSCAQGNDYLCEFNIVGNELIKAADVPAGTACGVNGWSALGNDDCFYHYMGELDEGHFRIVARSFGIANKVFLYDNSVGEMVECDASGAGATVIADIDKATVEGDLANPCN